MNGYEILCGRGEDHVIFSVYMLTISITSRQRGESKCWTQTKDQITTVSEQIDRAKQIWKVLNMYVMLLCII